MGSRSGVGWFGRLGELGWANEEVTCSGEDSCGLGGRHAAGPPAFGDPHSTWIRRSGWEVWMGGVDEFVEGASLYGVVG